MKLGVRFASVGCRNAARRPDAGVAGGRTGWWRRCGHWHEVGCPVAWGVAGRAQSPCTARMAAAHSLSSPSHSGSASAMPAGGRQPSPKTLGMPSPAPMPVTICAFAKSKATDLVASLGAGGQLFRSGGRSGAAPLARGRRPSGALSAAPVQSRPQAHRRPPRPPHGGAPRRGVRSGRSACRRGGTPGSASGGRRGPRPTAVCVQRAIAADEVRPLSTKGLRRSCRSACPGNQPLGRPHEICEQLLNNGTPELLPRRRFQHQRLQPIFGASSAKPCPTSTVLFPRVVRIPSLAGRTSTQSSRHLAQTSTSRPIRARFVPTPKFCRVRQT